MTKLKRKKTEEEKILIQYYPHILPKPTRFFKVGEFVRIGSLDNPEIIASYFEGKIYKIKTMEKKDRYGKKFIEVEKYFDWVSIHKIAFGNTNFAVDLNIRESLTRTDIEELIHTYYCTFGINMDAEYQRDLVWTNDEKTKLIDSIFNHVEIGRIVLRRLLFKNNKTKTYEIVDGKQRLYTLVGFFLGKWKYRGVLYEELSSKDIYTLNRAPIVKVIIENVTDLQILEYFIKINQTSHPIKKKHFEKIGKLIEEKKNNAK